MNLKCIEVSKTMYCLMITEKTPTQKKSREESYFAKVDKQGTKQKSYLREDELMRIFSSKWLTFNIQELLLIKLLP